MKELNGVYMIQEKGGDSKFIRKYKPINRFDNILNPYRQNMLQSMWKALSLILVFFP